MGDEHPLILQLHLTEEDEAALLPLPHPQVEGPQPDWHGYLHTPGGQPVNKTISKHEERLGSIGEGKVGANYHGAESPHLG